MAERKPPNIQAVDEETAEQRIAERLIMENLHTIQDVFTALSQAITLLERKRYMEGQVDALERRVIDLRAEHTLWKQRVEQLKAERVAIIQGQGVD